MSETTPAPATPAEPKPPHPRVVCVSCGRSKAQCRGNFSKMDGVYSTTCYRCVRLRENAEWRATKTAQRDAARIAGLHFCGPCGRDLPWTSEHFPANARRPNGLDSQCLDCHRLAAARHEARRPSRPCSVADCDDRARGDYQTCTAHAPNFFPGPVRKLRVVPLLTRAIAPLPPGVTLEPLEPLSILDFGGWTSNGAATRAG